MTDRRGSVMDDLSHEVRSFLDEQWDPELSLPEWRERLVDAGWACPTWPVEWYGRGLSASEASVVARRAGGRRRTGTTGRGRHRFGRADHPRARERRRETTLPPPDGHRRASVVPAVQRARLRVGSRRPGDSGRPRRRRVGRERAEAVEHERQPRRVRPARRRGPTGTPPSTAASRTSRSICGSPVSRFARFAR